MLEGQVGGSPMVSPLGEVQLVPAGRTQSNSSNLSQNTSASSNVSLSSSMGSSLVSSLGSTGSGMAATGGKVSPLPLNATSKRCNTAFFKVRQMFEDRRSQINGRPPVYSKTIQTRKVGPQKGWDRSHPLDPLPVGYERKPLAQPPKTRVRGVSLERGARMTRDETDSIRRSRSNYQVDNAGQTLEVPQGSVSTLKPKSLSNLLDDNQNPMATAKKIAPRYGYNSTIRPEVNETSTR